MSQRYLLIPPDYVKDTALRAKANQQAATPPRWIRGWGPRDIDTLVAKVLLDYTLWYDCESHLDVGANTQPYARFSSMIGARSARCDVRGYTSDCVLGALPRLPFRDKSYDLVSCLQVLEHLPDTQASIEELCRVAGKVAIIQVPNGARSVSRDDPTHIRFFTLRSLRENRVRGWTQRILASNVIATRLPHGVSMAQDMTAWMFTRLYANNFFVVYTIEGLKPKVRQPGLFENI